MNHGVSMTRHPVGALGNLSLCGLWKACNGDYSVLPGKSLGAQRTGVGRCVAVRGFVISGWKGLIGIMPVNSKISKRKTIPKMKEAIVVSLLNFRFT